MRRLPTVAAQMWAMKTRMSDSLQVVYLLVSLYLVLGLHKPGVILVWAGGENVYISLI